VNNLKQIIKKENLIKIAEIVLSVMLISAPMLVAAQWNSGNNAALCAGSGLNCQNTSVNGLIRTIINWLLGIAFGIAVLFLIIGGFGILPRPAMKKPRKRARIRLLTPLLV
jgi:hypothetical protein